MTARRYGWRRTGWVSNVKAINLASSQLCAHSSWVAHTNNMARSASLAEHKLNRMALLPGLLLGPFPFGKTPYSVILTILLLIGLVGRQMDIC